MTYKTNNKSERIAKVIARMGYCSRREAEKLISDGCVKVNGVVITSPAINITDESIKINNKLLSKKEKTRLWLYNKPKGTAVSTGKDEKVPTIFSLLPSNMPRVIAVGRLDINTEGLLLLTNNGELSEFISSPKTAWTRHYRVRVFGKLNKERFELFGKEGVSINGIKYKPIKIIVEKEGESANSWLKVSINEGKNREVKNIMAELGLKVTRLIRTGFGPFHLGNLESGLLKEVPTKTLKDVIGNNIDLD
ncbi:MAG TPA: pseudouridine synthase [Rickettsiales bacterium]|nr:pseudouridine synthase [Rickettsiales bacterium]